MRKLFVLGLCFVCLSLTLTHAQEGMGVNEEEFEVVEMEPWIIEDDESGEDIAEAEEFTTEPAEESSEQQGDETSEASTSELPSAVDTKQVSEESKIKGGACDMSVFAGDSWKTKLTYKEKLIAGSIGRFTGQSVMHPIEVVKSRMQARGVRGFRASSLLKGIIPQIGLSLPAGAIQFSFIELFKEYLSKITSIPLSADVKNFLAGVGGTFMAMCLRVPQEVLKQGCQTEVYENFGEAFTQIYTKTGLRGFYRGFWAQVARDLPWSGLSFMIFGMGKKFWEGVASRTTTENENLVIGAIGGGIAGALTNPIDVLKTRIMAQRAGEVAKYHGVVDAFSTILKEEGILTLFRGVLYRVLYLAPFGAVLYTAYELAGKELYRRRCEAQA